MLIGAEGVRLLWEMRESPRPCRSVCDEAARRSPHGKRTPVAEINTLLEEVTKKTIGKTSNFQAFVYSLTSQNACLGCF